MAIQWDDVVVAVAVTAVISVILLMVWLTRPFVVAHHQKPALTYKYQHILPEGSDKKHNSKSQNGGEWEISLFDEPSLYLSLVVPAYNEENRLHDMMVETLAYLSERQKADPSFTFEIIIVDDGSKDRTVDVALEYVKRYSLDVVRVLKLEANQGKGGAVQQGMLHSRGKYLLMVDADGASDIRDFSKLEQSLKKIESNGHGLAVGSRAHLAEAAVAQRKWYRNILMYGFHFLVWSLCVKQIKDTQCGFKLFARKTARLLFTNQHLRRWCFDVELLHIAEARGVPMAEVAIRWQEIPGSKLNLIDSSIHMARDLLVIRFGYMFGVWSIVDRIKSD